VIFDTNSGGRFDLVVLWRRHPGREGQLRRSCVRRLPAL